MLADGHRPGPQHRALDRLVCVRWSHDAASSRSSPGRPRPSARRPGQGQNPCHGFPAVLCARAPGGRHRHDHRRIRRREGHVLQVLSGQGRPDPGLPGEGRRRLDRQLHAAAEAAGPDPADRLVGLFDALASACRRDGYRGCAFINAAAESASGTRVHDRTVAHKEQVRAWIRDLADQAGAPDPDRLARSLTLVLDGGLASGVLNADPAAATAARDTAAQLVAAASERPVLAVLD